VGLGTCALIRNLVNAADYDGNVLNLCNIDRIGEYVPDSR